MPVVAGVDSSTQSTKVVLCDLDSGSVLGEGASPHPAVSPPVSEQDPGEWWSALLLAWRRALDVAGLSGSDVVAISVAAQCHGLVPLDAERRVLRPAKLWNDTTSTPQMRHLLERLPAKDWAARTGSVPTAAFTVSKLLWLREHEPLIFDRTAQVVLPHDWLTLQLTGRLVTDRSEASGTGYYDAEAGAYDSDILGLIDPHVRWGERLPAVLGPHEAVGTVTGPAAEALGVGPTTVVGPGAGDVHASALGLGARPGDRMISFGTSGVLFTVSPTAVHDDEGMVDGVADAAGGFLPLVSTLNAARVGDTFARLLGVDHQGLAELALAADTRHLPVLVAYLDGERKPNLPHARGMLAGLRTDVTREQVARAAIEGVIFGLKRGWEHLDRLGLRFSGRLVLTGGAAHSPAYQQLAADAFDTPVHLSTMSQSSAVGAAIQAAAISRGDTVQEVGRRWLVEPPQVAEPKSVSASAEAYGRYLENARHQIDPL